MKLLKWSTLISLLMVGVLLFSACGGGAPAPTPAPTEPPPPVDTPAPPAATPVPPTATPVPETPTPEPTPTPAGPDLGTEENPIIIAGVDFTGLGLHQNVCSLVAAETGYVIQGRGFADDAELASALAADETPHAIISFPAGYLTAHEGYGYEAALLGTQLGGQTGYTAQIIAGAGTGIASLADVAGRSVCWGDPDSLTGGKVQRLMLWAAGVDPDTQLGTETELVTHDQVVTAVYDGDCEVGAVYGGAVDRMEQRYPDVTTKVLVIAESPQIPNVCLSFAPGLPADVQQALLEGYMAVAESEDGAQALQMTYGWESLEEADDSLYEPLRELIRAARAEMDSLL